VGLTGAPALALTPLVAKTMLGMGAAAYGLLYAAFGFGATLGALLVAPAIRLHRNETIMRLCYAGIAAGVLTIALSGSLLIDMAALLLAGTAWMLGIALCNITMQLSISTALAGRAVSVYQTATAFGIASGSWLWGIMADLIGVQQAFLASSACVTAAIFLCWPFPLPNIGDPPAEAIEELTLQAEAAAGT